MRRSPYGVGGSVGSGGDVGGDDERAQATPASSARQTIYQVNRAQTGQTDRQADDARQGRGRGKAGLDLGLRALSTAQPLNLAQARLPRRAIGSIGLLLGFDMRWRWGMRGQDAAS